MVVSSSFYLVCKLDLNSPAKNDHYIRLETTDGGYESKRVEFVCLMDMKIFVRECLGAKLAHLVDDIYSQNGKDGLRQVHQNLQKC